MHLSTLLTRAAQRYGSLTAVDDGLRTLTYSEIHTRARRLVNALEGMGLRRGSSVAILLQNRLEYAEVDMALALGGYVRVAMNVRLGIKEFGYAVNDSKAEAIISESQFDSLVEELISENALEWIRMSDDGRRPARARDYEPLLAAGSSDMAPRQVDGHDVAWISYTSGTTGTPKGVILEHHGLSQVLFNLMLELGPIRPGDAILLPQPLSHGASYFLMAYLASGGRGVIMAKFDATLANELGRSRGISTLKAVPTMLNDFLAVGEDTPFDTIIYGAAPIGAAVLEDALDRFGPRFVQVYGQSEAPATLTCLRKEDHAASSPGRFSAGRPWRTVDIRIVDAGGQAVPVGEPGELIAHAPHAMREYLNRPEATAEVLRNGWVWTRDMARMDEHGFVHLMGRMDDVIITGGFNVMPAEVEVVISNHPQVRECVVLGVPDEVWGEAITAVVITDGQPVDVADIREFGGDELGFRKPKYVVKLDELPRSAYGKLDRKALKSQVAVAMSADKMKQAQSDV